MYVHNWCDKYMMKAKTLPVIGLRPFFDGKNNSNYVHIEVNHQFCLFLYLYCEV